jgi:hypothetical protein
MKGNSSEDSIHLENVVPTPPSHDVEEDKIGAATSLHDPQNWRPWKKNAQILMVAFHSMIG